MVMLTISMIMIALLLMVCWCVVQFLKVFILTLLQRFALVYIFYVKLLLLYFCISITVRAIIFVVLFHKTTSSPLPLVIVRGIWSL